MLDIWALAFARTVAVEVPLVAALVGNRPPHKRKRGDKAATAQPASREPAFWPMRLSLRWRLHAMFVALLANLISHPLLTGAIWYWIPVEHGSLAQYQLFYVLEAGVVLLEALILWLALPLRLWHAVALSLLVNLITAAMSPIVWG